MAQPEKAFFAPVGFNRAELEDLYFCLNRPQYVHPDPLEFVHQISSDADREVVGLIASSLAFGRVAQILASITRVLSKMGSSPSDYLRSGNQQRFEKDFDGFVHRFAGADALVGLCEGMRLAIERHGSLQNCFLDGWSPLHHNVVQAMEHFVEALLSGNGPNPNPLLPAPQMGSACKRLNLYLRWMVRKDAVDPGGWHDVPPSGLVVPLDTHLYSIARGWRITERKAADMKTAVEITDAFRTICPEDPVRYDFALTRIGIWETHGIPMPDHVHLEVEK